MSAIFGVVRWDACPDPSTSLRRLTAALAAQGLPDCRTCCLGAAGLGQRCLDATPEARFERLPATSPDGSFLLTAAGRLDNRDELAELLAVPASERAALPDGDLVLLAYARWGPETPRRLLGDWAFAAWHPRERRLFVARDQTGNTALYYHAAAREFVFSSSLAALLALPHVPRPLNERWLARRMVCWPGGDLDTAYRGVMRLPAGYSLTVTAAGARPARYWAPEDAPAVRLGSDEEYVEAFQCLYAAAVRCRLRSSGMVGATLSGGLDSGSVAALAARELSPKGGRLRAFTSAPAYEVSHVAPWRFGDESMLALETARHAGSVDLEFVRAEGASLVEGIGWVHAAQRQPGVSAANYHWIVAILRRAAGEGLRVLLTGAGGNATVSWTPPRVRPPLSHLLRTGGPRALVRHGLLSPVTPRPLREWWRGQEAGPAPWRDYCPIHDEFLRRMELPRLARELGRDLAFAREAGDPRRARLEWLTRLLTETGESWSPLGAAAGLEVRDPTLDRRLVEFCLGVPPAQFGPRPGQDRWLIRRATRDLLPREVRENRRKGLQAADIGHRVRAQAGAVEAALLKLERGSAAAYLDLARMRSALAAVLDRVDAGTTNQASAILLRGLDFGLFLHSLEAGEAAGTPG